MAALINRRSIWNKMGAVKNTLTRKESNISSARPSVNRAGAE